MENKQQTGIEVRASLRRWSYAIAALLICFFVHERWRSQVTMQHMPELLTPAAVDTKILTQIQEPIQPIPRHSELNAGKVALGDKLFHDPRLSRNNTIACASCHNLATGGVDQKI